MLSLFNLSVLIDFLDFILLILTSFFFYYFFKKKVYLQIHPNEMSDQKQQEE